MKVAFLIMAYKDPRQIERLIDRLARDGSVFYIHLDKKIDMGPFSYLSVNREVRFIRKRIKVNWGGYGLTAAILSSFREILEEGISYQFVSVMSGQDYPIRPVDSFYSYLQANTGKNFIYYKDPGEEWWSHAVSRVNKYHMSNFGFRGRYRLQFLINRILPKRKFPLPYHLYGGPCATFMTIGLDCVKYITDFMGAHSRLRRFAYYTWGTDEFLITTLIMNSSFKDSVVNDNLYYIDWSLGGSNPKVFHTGDFDALMASGKFLARKFDFRVDTGVLDLLDEANPPAKSGTGQPDSPVRRGVGESAINQA
ncbi:MAG: beta-1,6-N-acetylglucosaminyltransferase [Puia sp.]|nr:beta-1,6-N-acetylglucosaminyltransferase [Puia sp.]